MPRMTVKELHEIVLGHKSEIEKLKKAKPKKANTDSIEERLDRIEKDLNELLVGTIDEIEMGLIGDNMARVWSARTLREGIEYVVRFELQAVHDKIDTEALTVRQRLNRQDDAILKHGNTVRDIRNNFVGISKNIRKVVNEQGKSIRRLENKKPWPWSR